MHACQSNSGQISFNFQREMESFEPDLISLEDISLSFFSVS